MQLGRNAAVGHLFSINALEGVFTYSDSIEAFSSEEQIFARLSGITPRRSHDSVSRIRATTDADAESGAHIRYGRSPARKRRACCARETQ